MKFSHQIQFNSVPDWAEYYLPYSNLKKLIYSIERDRIADPNAYHHSGDCERGPNERTALLSNPEEAEEGNRRFISALDNALDKIVKFYLKKEKELYELEAQLIYDFDNLGCHTTQHDVDSIIGIQTDRLYQEEEYLQSPPAVGDDPILPPTVISQNTLVSDPEQTQCHSLPVWSREDNGDLTDLRKRTVDLFVLLSELKSFVALNQTAFSKILKKYDKITNSNLKRFFTSKYVGDAYPFKATTKQILNDHIQQIEHVYADLVTNGDLDAAVDNLKTHLREHIVWERNMVWRDMVGQERKTQTVGIDDTKPVVLHSPFGSIALNRDRIYTCCTLVLSVSIFIVLLQRPVFSEEEQSRCFAILVLASLLWAAEVMPLFVTALLVPFLVVILRVMRSDDEDPVQLSAPDATKRVFACMFSPVIMLLLGGFSIAGALSKFGIAKSVAVYVLSKAGKNPNKVLLVNMAVATVASMWISNVAAPVLCFSLIQPILRTLPVDSTFGPCLIMGIALASNLGGMASPISSPQNIIAIQNMNPPPSWKEWFLVSIPLCSFGIIIVWLWLMWNYNPTKQTPQIHTIRPTQDAVSYSQIYIVTVTLVTIILWCLAHSYEGFFGDMGVIAIIPVLAFFGPGLLTKDDFNNFLWNVIVLAMGGIVLGKAVESSGLLYTIAAQIEGLVSGMSAFQVLFVFSCLVLVIATFISHTVAALIVLPIVAEVGAELADPHPRLLVMGTAFMCSAAMGLPVSGFPNMNAISQENELGKPYLSTKDFLRNGVPSSVFTMLCVTTVGYGLMTLVGI